MPALKIPRAHRKPLVVIAEDADAEALSTVALSRLKGGSWVVAAEFPGLGTIGRTSLKIELLLLVVQYLEKGD